MSGILHSVVVPCARPERLPALAAAVRRQTGLAGGMELVVATPRRPGDDSGAGAADVVWVETGELFAPGRMRNLGAAQARGRFLFFIDDDCLPPPEWMAASLRVLDTRPDVAAVGCRVVGAAGDFWSRCADYVLFSATQSRHSGYRHLGSGALAVRTEVFRQAGGFDESLLASEDWDFGLRIQAAGWKSYFEAGVAVAHDHRRGSLRGILAQAHRSGWLSGLAVQRRHAAVLGPCARLAVHFSRLPTLYPFFALPYAALLTLLHAWEMRGVDRRWPLFLPFLAAGRLAYQFGVWRQLCREASTRE